MPFIKNSGGSCIEYDAKIDSCVPCTDKAKRKKCGQLYSLYKKASTPEEILQRRLDYYDNDCVSRECYDQGHCKALQLMDRNHPKVIEFCNRARENTFIPIDPTILSSLSFDELEGIVNGVLSRNTVVPNEFYNIIRSILNTNFNEFHRTIGDTTFDLDTLSEEIVALTNRVNDSHSHISLLQEESKALELELHKINIELQRKDKEIQNKIREEKNILSKLSSVQDSYNKKVSSIDRDKQYIARIIQLTNNLEGVSTIEEDVFSELPEPEEEQQVVMYEPTVEEPILVFPLEEKEFEPPQTETKSKKKKSKKKKEEQVDDIDKLLNTMIKKNKPKKGSQSSINFDKIKEYIKYSNNSSNEAKFKKHGGVIDYYLTGPNQKRYVNMTFTYFKRLFDLPQFKLAFYKAINTAIVEDNKQVLKDLVSFMVMLYNVYLCSSSYDGRYLIFTDKDTDMDLFLMLYAYFYYGNTFGAHSLEHILSEKTGMVDKDSLAKVLRMKSLVEPTKMSMSADGSITITNVDSLIKGAYQFINQFSTIYFNTTVNLPPNDYIADEKVMYEDVQGIVDFVRTTKSQEVIDMVNEFLLEELYSFIKSKQVIKYILDGHDLTAIDVCRNMYNFILKTSEQDVQSLLVGIITDNNRVTLKEAEKKAKKYSYRKEYDYILKEYMWPYYLDYKFAIHKVNNPNEKLERMIEDRVFL